MFILLEPYVEYKLMIYYKHFVLNSKVRVDESDDCNQQQQHCGKSSLLQVLFVTYLLFSSVSVNNSSCLLFYTNEMLTNFVFKLILFVHNLYHNIDLVVVYISSF